MNRNWLKIIAVISMLVDHIGAYFFADIIWFRVVGRLAFVLFAFFVCEGWKKTSNRKKYFCTLLLFACVSQVPYHFLCGWKLNILFTYVLAIVLIYLIEHFDKNKIVNGVEIACVVLFLVAVEWWGFVDYGMAGVALVLIFYFFDKKWQAFGLATLCMALLTFKNMALSAFSFENSIQIFSVLALGLIALYNGEKGKLNLKWLFWVFYPTHLCVVLLIMQFV